MDSIDNFKAKINHINDTSTNDMDQLDRLLELDYSQLKNGMTTTRSVVFNDANPWYEGASAIIIDMDTYMDKVKHQKTTITELKAKFNGYMDELKVLKASNTHIHNANNVVRIMTNVLVDHITTLSKLQKDVDTLSHKMEEQKKLFIEAHY